MVIQVHLGTKCLGAYRASKGGPRRVALEVVFVNSGQVTAILAGILAAGILLGSGGGAVVSIFIGLLSLSSNPTTGCSRSSSFGVETPVGMGFPVPVGPLVSMHISVCRKGLSA
jgi:hypothetical protein